MHGKARTNYFLYVDDPFLSVASEWNLAGTVVVVLMEKLKTNAGCNFGGRDQKQSRPERKGLWKWITSHMNKLY